MTGNHPPMDRGISPPSDTAGLSRQIVRLASMFHSPGRTFNEIAWNPTIAVVLTATALAGAVTATAVSRASDFDAMVQYAYEQQVETIPGSFAGAMSDADRARALDATRTGLRITRNLAPVVGGLGAMLAPVVAAAVLLLVFGIMGTPGSYRSLLSTVTHAWWPAAAASGVLTTVVAWLSYPLAPERAEAPLRSNLAALIPDLGSPASVVAARVDIFIAWELILLGIGLAIAFGISRRTSFLVAFSLWALVTAGATGVVFAFDLLDIGTIAAAP